MSQFPNSLGFCLLVPGIPSSDVHPSGGGRSQEQSGPHDHTGAAVRGCKRSAQFLPGTAGWCKPDGQDEEAELGKGDMAQAGMEMGQGGGNSEAGASTGW